MTAEGRRTVRQGSSRGDSGSISRAARRCGRSGDLVVPADSDSVVLVASAVGRDAVASTPLTSRHLTVKLKFIEWDFKGGGVRKHRHALSGAIYEYADDGVGPVLVSKDGVSGLFTADGVWVRGEMRSADPQMCRWIASGGLSDMHLRMGDHRARVEAMGPDDSEGAIVPGGTP
jgi:hypothetical protein